MILIPIVAGAAGLAAAAVAVMKSYRPFGGRAPAGILSDIRRSPRYIKGKFVNEIPASMDNSLKGGLSMARDFVKRNPNARPAVPLVPERSDLPWLSSKADEPWIVWFGHSALLLRIDGVTLLLDPMLGPAPSPFPWIGGKRYSKELPAVPEDFPEIDAVLLSHDHYDHMDYGTIRRLKSKVGRFIVPLGVGGHLLRWGIEPGRIEEHDWWDTFSFKGLKLACTPARHFSGRSLLDRDATLWCSWVIEGSRKLFFSGDSGYGPHFRAIGQKFGPFDLTMMECGQYDDRWADIHMTPEQTVQAHREVGGGWLLPIHWGAFTLAFHDWTDPVARVLKAASEQGVRVTTPRAGEPVRLAKAAYPAGRWWE
ncbi:MBL fold metallo-hydrolase [Shouchella clausii]